MDRRFLGILAAIVIIFAGIFLISQNSSNSSNGSSGSNSNQPTNHVEGQGSSGVKLVEYGDYECPVCREYYQSLNTVYDQFKDKIYFQFRNLPLSQIHPNAFAAARAAEAAGLQGKYWQMHDQIYENQDPTGATGWVVSRDPLNQYFVKFAQNIGLNVSQFKQDYSSDKANNAINADLNEFAKTGQSMATPTFFLDGRVLDNAKLGVQSQTNPGTLDQQATVANFAKVINAEIAKKTGTNNQ